MSLSQACLEGDLEEEDTLAFCSFSRVESLAVMVNYL